MTREALVAISAGLTSAIASVAFLSGSFLAFFIVYLAPLPMLLAGLSYGLRAAAIAAFAWIVAMGFLGGFQTAGFFVMTHALPAWVIVKLALLARTEVLDANGTGTLRWMDSGQIVSVMTALAAGLLVLAALAVGDVGLSGYLAGQLEQTFKLVAPEMEAMTGTRIASTITPMLPGVVLTSWLVMMAVNAAIAQGLLVRIGRNRRPSPSYVGLELPGWLSWPLVGAAAMALVGSGEWEYMGRNMAMVLALPYFFLGLAVFHTLARRVSATKPLLVAFYLVIVISVWAALVVAGIGVVEQWFGLRGRIASPGPQNGPTGGPDEE